MSDIEPWVAGAVREWISGQRDAHERFFFARTAEEAAAFDLRATGRDVVLVPDGSPAPDDDAAARGERATLIFYRGALRDPGDEIVVSGRSIELQDYAAAAFVDVLGPTLVRFMDVEGWQAFLEDADIARETGVLPPQLRDPRMQLADRAVLLAPLETVSPDSFASGAEDRVRYGPQGVDLGRIDDPDAYLRAQPRIAALGGVVAVADAIAAVRARPWLARLIALADLRHALPPDQGYVPTSGFGVVLVDDEGADADPLPRDPFILFDDVDPLLVDAVSRRRFRLDLQTARVVEIVQTSASEGLAAERIAAASDVPIHAAARLAQQALEALDIHLGVPREAGGISAGGDAE